MALTRATPSGWLHETGTLSRATPSGWVQETQGGGAGVTLAGAATASGSASADLSVSGAAVDLSGAATVSGTGSANLGVTDPIPACTITLRDEAGAIMANQSNIAWAWFDAVRPQLLAAPTDQGTSATDANGVMVIQIPNTTRTSGQLGSVLVSNSDGTISQDPPPRSAWAPAQVD